METARLDKIFAERSPYSRSEIRKLVNKQQVWVITDLEAYYKFFDTGMLWRCDLAIYNGNGNENSHEEETSSADATAQEELENSGEDEPILELTEELEQAVADGDYSQLGEIVAPVQNASDKYPTDVVILYAGELFHPIESQLVVLLHKPMGYICSNRDETKPTVLRLLPDNYRQNFHTIGRLDSDTTGLLFITNDGQLTHDLLAPKKHVAKTYRVLLAAPADVERYQQAFTAGIHLRNEKTPCKPATMQLVSSLEATPDVFLDYLAEADAEELFQNSQPSQPTKQLTNQPTRPTPEQLQQALVEEKRIVDLTIAEGRYHQVKRMFAAVGNAVLALHRYAMGEFQLPPDLAVGKSITLTSETVLQLVHGELSWEDLE